MKKYLASLMALLFMIIAAPLPLNAKDKKAASGIKERIISREGRSKVGKDKTKVDFEDAEIGGMRKAPMASMLNNTKAKKEYDMVPIRTDWKPEMIQSASSLDAAKSN